MEQINWKETTVDYSMNEIMTTKNQSTLFYITNSDVLGRIATPKFLVITFVDGADYGREYPKHVSQLCSVQQTTHYMRVGEHLLCAYNSAEATEAFRLKSFRIQFDGKSSLPPISLPSLLDALFCIFVHSM